MLTISPVSGGSATITVTANDGDGTASTTFTVTVNRPPVVSNAIPDQVITINGTPFTRNLESSPRVFSDPDGDALSYSASSSAQGIAAASVSGSTLTVTAVAGGSATITVTANDNRGGTQSTSFTVTVNRPPVVSNAIPEQIVTVDGAPFTRNLESSPRVFTDPDGDALSYSVISTAEEIATAEIFNNVLTVEPVSGGNATIILTADDGRGGMESTTFTVAVNLPPTVIDTIDDQIVMIDDAPFVRNLNTSPRVFTDPDGDALSYSVSSSAEEIAAAAISGSILTVTPIAGGSATITINADDGRGGTGTTSFEMIVNRPPVVINAIPNQILNVGGPAFMRDLNAPPVFEDPDEDMLSYSANSSADTIATASISGSVLTVSAVAGGTATITVTANDGQGGTQSVSFMVTVNRFPVVRNMIPNQALTLGGPSFSRDLEASPEVFFDEDGDILTYGVSSSAEGVARAEIAGSVLTVTSISVGSTTITVTANDNKGGIVSTVFTVEVVTTQNQPPVVVSTIPAQTLILGEQVFTLDLISPPAVFNDPDGDELFYTASSSAPAIATVRLSGSTLTVEPVSPGRVTITVSVNDNRGGAVSTMFPVSVIQRNRAPVVANIIGNQTLRPGGAPFTRDLNAAPAIFTDPDGDPLKYSAISSSESIAIAEISGTTLIVSPIAAGSVTIMVTAVDDSSATASTIFSVTVEAKNQRPIVEHTPALEQPANQDIVIVADITDDEGIERVDLFYRQGGDASFNMAGMSLVEQNSFQGIIPSIAVGSRGVEYFIVAEDDDGLSAREPAAGIHSIRVVIAEPGIVRTSAQPHGSEQNAYRLISLPLDLDNKNPNVVLSDDLGPYDIAQWRFFEISPSQSYVELPNTGGMAPGKGFWLIVREAGKFIDTGAGRTVSTENDFAISLHGGWNYVGTPFDFEALALDSLSDGTSFALYAYTGTWSDPLMPGLTLLRPFEAYAVFNQSSATTTLFVNPSSSGLSNSVLKEITPGEIEPLWSIRIVAQSEQARDANNIAGVISSASQAWDGFDHPEPPVIGEYVSVYFTHPEWGMLTHKYTTDYRPEPADGEIWRFEVRTNIEGEVKLAFEGIEHAPLEYELWLMDQSLNMRQNLRKQGIYTVSSQGLGDAKPLQLIVGKREYIAQYFSTFELIPLNYELAQNYPNPFNPVTTIRYGLPTSGRVNLKIYNILGEEIATLVDDEIKQAGYHSAIWDGRDSMGQSVASSIYFYRLQVGNFGAVRKMALTR